MKYFGTLNKYNIKRINGYKLGRTAVLGRVNIDKDLLAEKDSWYLLNDQNLYFFKKRHDARLFGECISQKIFEEVGFETAKYEIVYLNDILGLITPNFQDVHQKKYYDLITITNLFSTFPRGYGNITYKEVLENIYYLNLPNSSIVIQELINRYVGEWITHQIDGNPRNIIFSVDKKTQELEVGPSFDRENCLGIDNSGFFNSDSLKVWIPAIPYEDKDFKKNPYTIEGADANITALFIDYPEETLKAFEKIFSIDYNSLFRHFKSGILSFSLDDDTINYLNCLIDGKYEEKEKILSL